MDPFEIGQALIEGLALILSPCILPVLPLMLSGSVQGGKARPFGITLGFILAFSIFVLASRQIVNLFHINPDILRYASLVLLFGLGLIMLSGKLSAAFSQWTQGFANLGLKANAKGRDGFGGGMAIGALIGLVWTPCAGPILAAVLVQVIRQQTDVQSILITMSFAAGAALPMLLITLAGKQLIKKFGVLTKHSEDLRKVFAVLILLSVGFMAYGGGISNPFAAHSNNVASGLSLKDGLAKPYPSPEFQGIETWLNSPPLTMAGLKGKVVLVDFWTYSCINCVRTLPIMTALYEKYRDQGLVIIGVHAPEFEFEKNIDNINTALERHHIEYPVAVDNHLSTWVNFANKYWPAHYLIDKEGRVVYTHFGEGQDDVTENNIRYLLGLTQPGTTNIVRPQTLADETPETYLGYARAERFSLLSNFQKDQPASYMPISMLPLHHWSLGGLWKSEIQKITALEKGSYLRLNFKARKVYLVMGTVDGQPQTVTLKLNGALLVPKQAGKDVVKSMVTINGHTLYELVNQPMPDNGELEISAGGAGVEMYAFTFGE